MNATKDTAYPSNTTIPYSMSIGVTRKGGAGGSDGSGVIVSVTLEAIGNGDTDISFNSETIELNGSDNGPIDGFSSLSVGSAQMTVRKSALVARGKLLITWGYVRQLWKGR